MKLPSFTPPPPPSSAQTPFKIGITRSKRTVKVQPPVQHLNKLTNTPFPKKSLQERTIQKTGITNKVKVLKGAKGAIPEMTGKVLPAPRLGDVKIGEMLGQGAFGQVYLARVSSENQGFFPETPNKLQKQYVIKDQNFGHDYTSAQDRLNMATKEVNIQRRANGAVPVAAEVPYGNETTGFHHQVMMKHGGQELSKLIYGKNKDSSQPVNEGLCRALGKQILGQLSDLHKQGAIHRDLKPDNILIDHRGKAALADFGLAEQGRTGAPDNNNFYGVIGTPVYMAPEVFSQPSYSMKADSWSAGMVLAQMLTGQPPVMLYDGVSSGGQKTYTFNQNKYNEFISDISSDPKLSTDAKELILGMLQIDPVNRLSAEQAHNHRFFQTPKLSYSELQTMHQMKFRELALLETRLELAHTSNAIKTIEKYEKAVSIVGSEVKSLQQKMEIEDLKVSLQSMKKKLKKMKIKSFLTSKGKQDFNSLTKQYNLTSIELNQQELKAHTQDIITNTLKELDKEQQITGLEKNIKKLVNEINIINSKINYFKKNITALNPNQQKEFDDITKIKNQKKLTLNNLISQKSNIHLR